MIIAVDFDDVLNDRQGKNFGKPLPGAEAAIEAITQEGIEVVVFTCVAATKSGREAVISWLEKYDIDYSDVTAVKSDCDLYIDNKGLHHTSWDKTIKEINKRLETEIEL